MLCRTKRKSADIKSRMSRPHQVLIAFFTLLFICLLNVEARADAFWIGQYPLKSGGLTGTLNINNELSNGNLLCFTITNSATNPIGVRITSFAFDIPGNRGPFTLASPLPNTTNFSFSNDPRVADIPILDLNNPVIPTIDFTFLTGSTFRDFANQHLGLAPGETSAVFCVTGNFEGLTHEQIAHGIYVRFERGEFGWVGVFAGPLPTPEPVPEPGTMILLVTGLGGVIAAARRKRKVCNED
jgi:hypothetical protein